MAQPSVNITIANGGLGLTASTVDRIVGLIFHGITTTSAERAPKAFFSYESVVAFINGIAAAEAVNKALILEQVADFYSLAGPGAELWIALADATQTTAQLFDQSLSTSPARRLQEASTGRISVIGYSRQKAATVSAGIADEVLNAITTAQQCGDTMASRARPVRILLDGFGFAGDVTTLPDLRLRLAPRVGVVLSRRASGQTGVLGACVGLVLGRVAATAPHRNLGRVQDGAVSATAYLTATGDPINTLGQSVMDNVHDKGYICLRSHDGLAGYFFNNDLMATGSSDDFFCLAHGRIIDKSHRLVYQTYLTDVLDNVELDPTTGFITPIRLKHYQGKAERALEVQMKQVGEISGVKAFVDPKQDVLGTGKLKITVKIVPTGTLRTIEVTLGLTNPAVRS